jgi:hypothetical protein
MGNELFVIAILLFSLVCANLPFLNERFFLIGPHLTPKHLGWQLFELVIYGLLVVSLGFLIESFKSQRHVQGWEFYVSFGCLFLTLAFPGFVWRYLRRG